MITTGAAEHVNRDSPTDVAALYARVCGWGIPAREVELVMNGLRDTTTLGYAKTFLEDANKVGEPSDRGSPPTMLVLAGHTGVGKTIAAAWVMFHANPLLPHGVKWKTEQAPKFRHVSELAQLSGYGEADKPERTAIKTTKCLVVDDLGAEICTDHFAAMFDAVINARYGCLGYTILTTNLTSAQFSERYGERVYDRIRGRGEWYDISEPSMRGK